MLPQEKGRAAARPYGQTMPDLPIPQGPESLSREWLTDALRENGAISRAAVVDFETEPVGEEFGFTGRLVRVTLRYDLAEAHAPRSLVAKFPNPSARLAADPARRARFYERYAREVRFYEEFGCEAGIRTPSQYYGDSDADSGKFVLLLEDLTPCRIGDAMRHLSRGDLELLLDAIAKFHAAWWQHPRLLEIDWLPHWGIGSEAAQARLQRSRSPFLEQFGRWLPEPVHDLIDGLTPVYGQLLRELASPPWTMIHADLHADNLLFDVPGAPLAVVDWQGVARGRAAVDLSRTVGEWPDRDERRELLRMYHSTLLEHGVGDYDFDQLLRDCRLALLQNLGGVANGYATFDEAAASEREREMVQRFFEEGQLFKALLEHDAGDLLGDLARRSLS